jgi:DNA-binding IclR family transcriptional regulator
MSDRYLIRAVTEALAVEEWLASGALLEWKSLEEVSLGVPLTRDKCYRILKTLAAAGRLEESDKGWRVSPEGLIRLALETQKYFDRLAQCYGVKVPGQKERGK